MRMRIPRHPLIWTVVAGVIGLPGLLEDIGTWEKWLTMEGWEPWRYWSVSAGVLIAILAWRSTVERWLAKMPYFSDSSTLKEDNHVVQQLLDQIDRRDREIDNLRRRLAPEGSQEANHPTIPIDGGDVRQARQHTPRQLTALVTGKMDIEAERLVAPYIGMDMILSVKVQNVTDFRTNYKVDVKSEDGVSIELTYEKDNERTSRLEVERLTRGETVKVRGKVSAIYENMLFLNECVVL